MTVWARPLSLYARRRSKSLLYFVVLFVVIITTIFSTALTFAAPSTNRTISFSARLKSISGAVVPDGDYNVTFRLYNVGQGGTPIWSETYHDVNGAAAGQDNRVRVLNGYLNVKLGSLTTFGSSVNWDDSLWLTMDIGGVAQEANIEAIDWDGEMSPRIQLTAVPYAISAGSIGGKTAGDFVQLGQGAQVDASNNTSIHINKTGTGDLIQLQHNADDIFTVSSAGDITLGGDNDHTISVAPADASTDGYALTISGGDGGSGTTNGGNLVLTGGSGSEGGADGLVVLTTPTFSTTTNDSNCYTGGAIVTSSCTISQTAVDNSAAVMVGFSVAEQTATLPDPTHATAGQILYVIAATDSLPFTLVANGSDSMSVQPKTAQTLLWNGSDWVLAGGNSSPGGSLQNAYDASVGSAEIIVNGSTNTGTLTIRDSSSDPVDNAILTVTSATSIPLLTVNSGTAHNLASNPGGETAGESGTTFPADTWTSYDEGVVSRHTTPGDYIASGNASIRLTEPSAGHGVTNRLSGQLKPSSSYRVSVKLYSTHSTPHNISLVYDPDGSSEPASEIACGDAMHAIEPDSWVEMSCTIQTPSGGITADNSLAIVTLASLSGADIYIDDLSVKPDTAQTPNVQIGSGESEDSPTLLSLSRSGEAPTGSDNALLGSMYYDTAKGKVQCYEAAGWGACGDAPDTFVTLSPQYTNAVMNGEDDGVITSDICSDTLNINDGSPGQPPVCGENETYNFYGWTTNLDSDQTRSIYLTYQLPDNFKSFVPGSTSVMARTDSADATVSYQVYRDDGSGLTSCGELITASNGTKSLWQKSTATNDDDPADCGFEQGDSLLLRINLTAKDDANAYVSNINFTYSNN